jgi:hypothetical protein
MYRTWLVVVCLFAAASPALAQNWEFDARKVAMGSAGGGDLTERILAERRGYRVIPIPLGLFQILKDTEIFKPGSDRFDIVRAIEYSMAPFHYVVGRDATDSDAGRRLVVDIGNAELSRDLNAYRGFVPSRQPVAEGLGSPSWGKTFRVAGEKEGTNHGIFVGAGPYLAMRTGFDIDQKIIDTLASSTNVYFPNTNLALSNSTTAQFALAITGGYRGTFATGGGSDENYVLVAIDYNHIKGFKYEDLDTAVRLDTDGAGLLTVRPTSPPPLIVGRDYSESGTGFAIDAAVATIVGPWEAGVSVNGIGNRINWKDVQREVRVLGNLFTGNDEFIESPAVAIGDVEVELPVDTRLHGGYYGDRFSALAEYRHGFNGDSIRGGVEYGFGAIDVRGGGYKTRGIWQPTVGVGLNMGPRVSLDVAVFGTSANVQRERRTAIAVSLRLNRPNRR